MTNKMRTAVAVAGAALIAVPATAGIASGDPGGYGDGGGVRTVATGLDGPRQLSPYLDSSALVAESDSGEVSSVDLRTGDVKTLVSGLTVPQGVGYADGLIYIAVAGPPPPADNPPPTTPTTEPTTPTTEPTTPTGPTDSTGPTTPTTEATTPTTEA